MPSLPGVPASEAAIFVDEFELTQQSSGAEFNSEMQTLQYPIMGDATIHQEITTPNFSIPHRGYYTGRGVTGGLGYFEDALQSRLGTTLPVVVTLVLGPVAYTLYGTWGSQLTIDAPVDGLITIEGNWASPDSVRRGRVIPANNYSDLETSPAIDLGAANVANGVVLHASGFADLTSGSELVTVNIQTAATEGGAYTTWLTTAPGAFKKPGAVIVSGANNPNRWVRVQVDLSAGIAAGSADVVASVLLL